MVIADGYSLPIGISIASAIPVEEALRQPEIGIILMGTCHKQGVQAGLMASCQN